MPIFPQGKPSPRTCPEGSQGSNFVWRFVALHSFGFGFMFCFEIASHVLEAALKYAM